MAAAVAANRLERLNAQAALYQALGGDAVSTAAGQDTRGQGTVCYNATTHL